MVKARQRSFRAFIFSEGDMQETIAYIDKNYILLKDYLLVFVYPLQKDTELYVFLSQKGLSFIESIPKNAMQNGNIKLEASGGDASLVKLKSASVIDAFSVESKVECSKSEKTMVLHRTIRSGEEIITQCDITIFGRINNGAHIQSSGNIQIFGNISGNVFCDGDYMLLGKVLEGNVLFQGEIVDKALLIYPYNKIYKKNDVIIVQELV